MTRATTRTTAILGLLALGLVFTAPSTARAAEWTFLVYIDGDNNLEEDALDDFLEIASVGSNASLNFVVLVDRIDGYATTYGNWTGCRRGLIAPGDQPTEAWGENMGELNMGDPQTLVDFVNWGLATYPADKVGVILWNHGGGWRSRDKHAPVKAVCWDDTNGGDCLYMKEVREAFETIASGAGGPVDLVGFDACLMGMVEVAYELRDVAGVMVASEETEPVAGWPYHLFLADLAAEPAMGAAGLGTAIVERYYESYGNDETQSAVDLSQMENLASAIDTLSQALRTSWQTGDGIPAAATDVQQVIDAAVIHERHGPSFTGATGLSIYFASDPASSYNGGNVQFPDACQWDEFLEDFSPAMADSWIDDARDATQYFSDSDYRDLSDFCRHLKRFVPDDLAVSPESGFAASGPVGGPFSPLGQTFTLTNTGDESLDWTASVDQSWLRVSSTGGALAPGAAADLVCSLDAAAAGALAQGLHTGALTIANMTSGNSRDIGVVLRVGIPDYLTQQFGSDSFDLAGKTLTLRPADSEAGYEGCIEPASAFPTDPTGGSPLNLADDGHQWVAVTGGARIPFFDQSYLGVFVGSNGFLTFGEGDNTYSETLTAHFGLPRISPLFNDFNPSSDGSVSARQTDDRLAVTWQDIPEYGSHNENSFQVECFFDGTIRMTWIDIAAVSGIAGVSSGAGLPQSFEPSDLSGLGSCEPPAPGGTVVVSVSPEAASWRLTDADGVETEGTGSQSVPGLTPGLTTLLWLPLDGYRTPTPNEASVTLADGASETFNGGYEAVAAPTPPPATPEATSLLDEGFDAGEQAGWQWFDAVPALSAPQRAAGAGRLTITATSNADNFGIWQSPDEIIPADAGAQVAANALFRARYAIETDVADRAQAPSLRFRTQDNAFTLANYVRVDSVGQGSCSPQAGETSDYELWFEGGAAADTWNYVTFELINFDTNDEAGATFELDRVRIDQVDVGLFDLEGPDCALATYDFDGDDAQGWTPCPPGSLPGYTVPDATVTRNGLWLTSENNTDTFGYWTSGAVSVPGGESVLLRAVFRVSSSVADAADVPDIRCRVNQVNFETMAAAVISSTGAGQNSPTEGDFRSYPVYLRTAPDARAVLLSFDLVNFGGLNQASAGAVLDSVEVLAYDASALPF